MKTIVLTLLNVSLVAFFIFLLRRRELLSYHHQGRWWLTWLAIAVITLMDEFTSIFYVPAEAYRFIGLSAIVFIGVTSLLIRFLTTRLTEIAEVLEQHGLIGGGVYSFSYLVLGPMVSFMEYEFGDRQVVVHLGWPLSSWLDRLAIGVMIFNMMRLPRLFPYFRFVMSYTEHTTTGAPSSPPEAK